MLVQARILRTASLRGAAGDAAIQWPLNSAVSVRVAGRQSRRATESGCIIREEVWRATGREASVCRMTNSIRQGVVASPLGEGEARNWP